MRLKGKVIIFAICFIATLSFIKCSEEEILRFSGDGKRLNPPKKNVLDLNIGKSREASRTDDETVEREEEAIKIDSLNISQMKELRDKAQKHEFQAEVERMMKLIINSLYKNKEIFLRELISNGSDALDKIRFMSLTDSSVLAATGELSIKIRANRKDKTLHIVDTGIGMTHNDLTKNLGTIAKSGTSEFLNKLTETKSQVEMNDMIGQFGVGFYSAFLVADRVTVISKHNNDEQYIWESDAASFTVIKDPRGNTLKRGTEVILHLQESAEDYLESETLKQLVTKYSQFINFPIYVWTKQTKMVDQPNEQTNDGKESKGEEADKDADTVVEEEKEKEKEEKTTKKVEKTVWDWELINQNKPIWTRKLAEVKDEEYNEFYKAFSKDKENPLAKVHFKAEGEVTFKSILFIPQKAPSDIFQNMHSNKHDNIKMYVRRVFITDDFGNMMPKYLSFINGVVDSDDLPLNVSRETLQQNKLLKVIKKKLVRKALDMIKKMNKEDFLKFYKEFSTSLKWGLIEDGSNRTRIAKLLRFWSSHSDKDMTSLEEYLSRMKEGQDTIYYIAGQNKEEVKKSPFVERLMNKGYEIIYLIEPIDEYVTQTLTDFDGKKIQNVAKEGLKLENTEKMKGKKEELAKEFKPLMEWIKDDALKDIIEKVEISDRLTDSPCALVATTYGWSGNMERIMTAQAYQKMEDPNTHYHMGQRKILEINPWHPLIRELKTRVAKDKDDQVTRNLALVLLDTATLRSGYHLKNTASFAERIEQMLRLSMNIDLNEKVQIDEDFQGTNSEVKPEVIPQSDEEKDEEKETLKRKNKDVIIEGNKNEEL